MGEYLTFLTTAALILCSVWLFGGILYLIIVWIANKLGDLIMPTTKSIPVTEVQKMSTQDSSRENEYLNDTLGILDRLESRTRNIRISYSYTKEYIHITYQVLYTDYSEDQNANIENEVTAINRAYNEIIVPFCRRRDMDYSIQELTPKYVTQL